MSIHLKLTAETIALLNELAGGERHKSEYVERIIPILHRATQAGKASGQRQQTQALAETLAAMLADGAAPSIADEGQSS